MSANLHKPRGAAALSDIIARLSGFEAERSGAEAPLVRTPLRFGRAGPVARAPRRPVEPAEPLLDIDFDGRRVIVTTETEGPAATAEAEETCLRIRCARARERRIALPCRVSPGSLQVTILNGVLEATMAAQEPTA
jgi:hypothetical protein